MLEGGLHRVLERALEDVMGWVRVRVDRACERLSIGCVDRVC